MNSDAEGSDFITVWACGGPKDEEELCGSTSFELTREGEVLCVRCGCRQRIAWSFTAPEWGANKG